MRHALLVMCFPVLLQAQGVVLTAGAPRDVGMSEEALRPALELYRDAVVKRKIVGAVVLIARHGRVIAHEAFGLRDLRGKLPMEPTTMFRLSSNTESLTAAGVAVLADAQKVRFTDSVKAHVPSWDTDRARAITIHQLLSHTSGIEIDGMFAPTWYRLPWQRLPTLRSEANRIGKVGAKRSPGTTFFPTSAGYNALGGLIEVVSQRRVDEFMRDELFTKLGMSDSYFHEEGVRRDAKLRRMAPAYLTKEPGLWSIVWSPGDPPEVPFPRGSGGFITTAWDYAVFMQMMMNGGEYAGVRVLRQETVDRMLSPHMPLGAPAYGYGSHLSDGAFFQSGQSGSYAWADPKRGLIVVAMAFTSSAADMRSEMIALVNRAVDARE